MKYAVKFGRPTFRTIGKNKTIVLDDEPVYTSKCGRFRIEKHLMGSANGCWNNHEYRVFRIADEKRLGTCDHLRDARGLCEFEVNPDWEA